MGRHSGQSWRQPQPFGDDGELFEDRMLLYICRTGGIFVNTLFNYFLTPAPMTVPSLIAGMRCCIIDQESQRLCRLSKLGITSPS